MQKLFFEEEVQMDYLIYLQMQTAASSLALESGTSHVGKKGFIIYSLNVSATMVCEQGLTIRHSTHNLMNAINGPKDTMM